MTSAEPTTFGSRCLTMIETLPWPSARAPVTNSFSRSDSTSPRTMRAKPAQLRKPTARMIDVSPGPSAPAMMTATRISGRPQTISTSPFRILPTQPRGRPAAPVRDPVAPAAVRAGDHPDDRADDERDQRRQEADSDRDADPLQEPR